MIFSVYSLSLFNLYQGYLNANNSFIVSAFAPFIANVTVIVFIVISGLIDYRLLPFGFMVGYLLQFIGIFPELKKTGYSHRMSVDIHDCVILTQIKHGASHNDMHHSANKILNTYSLDR